MDRVAASWSFGSEKRKPSSVKAVESNVPHPFDDPSKLEKNAAHHDLGGDKLSQRQLADSQQPAGGRDEAAMRDGLPPERAQVLPDQNAESGLPRPRTCPGADRSS